VVAAAGAGVIAGQIVGPTAAMDWHRQVVFTDGDHAAAEPADGPLAPSAFREIESDENAQSEDQFANLLIGVLVLRERRQFPVVRVAGGEGIPAIPAGSTC
jgi:hypothetical protein